MMQLQRGVLSYRLGIAVRPVASRCWLSVSASVSTQPETIDCASSTGHNSKNNEAHSVSRLSAARCPNSAPFCPLKQSMLAAHRRPLHFTHSSSSQIRWNSSSTLFGVGGKQVNLTDLGAIPDAPAVPLPAPPEATVQELWNAGESVLEPLGLWSAYTPPSYIRWGLESIHQNFDVPWWVCIVGLTVTMRLGLIFVPILSQRLSAKLQQHRVPLAKFQERLNDARAEQDKTQMALVFQERMDYQRKHDIKMWRQFLVLAINGGVFMTHFLALKKMAAADMPGFSSEGLWWFQDLAACDPYLILPLVSAFTIGIVAHLGIESGVRADQMNTSWWLPYVMKFGVPTVVFCFTSFYPSALCVYWCTSNAMSLIYAGVFRIPAVRELCKIPPVGKDIKPIKKQSSFMEQFQRQKKTAAISVEEMEKNDMAAFKRAGQKPPPRVSRAPTKKWL